MLMIVDARWHVDDPIGRWMERFPNTKFLRYAALGEPGDWTVEQGFREVGEPLMPAHKPLDFLMERRSQVTAPRFASDIEVLII